MANGFFVSILYNIGSMYTGALEQRKILLVGLETPAVFFRFHNKGKCLSDELAVPSALHLEVL